VRKTFLYFFKAEGRIKIGISQNVKRRVGDVSRTSGLKVECIGSLPGSYAFEKHLHKKLAEHRLEGEWFIDCDDVRAVINSVLENGYDAVGFVEPPPLIFPSLVRRERTPAEWIAIDHQMLALLWPGDGYREFAQFVEAPVEQVKRWFMGEERWPRVYRFAFSSLVGMTCAGDGHFEAFMEKVKRRDQQEAA
jgi:hypothetical protein